MMAPLRDDDDNHAAEQSKPVAVIKPFDDVPASTAGDAPQTGHFEDVIDLLGTFGHWQRVVFIGLCMPDFLGAYAMMVVVFVGATPKWTCEQYVYRDADLVLFKNGSEFPNSTMQCSLGNWSCFKFSFHDDFTSIVGEWDLLCSRRWIISLISSIQMIGLATGAGLFGYLADWFGRKKCYFFCVFIMCVGGIGSGFTYHWILYAVTRFVVGFGFGSYMVVNCVYPLEFVGPRWRTLCGTIGFWAIGIMILAVYGYFIREWRHLVITTSASGLIFLIFWIIVPESPRWLLQRGKVDEAYQIVHRIAKKNGVATPDRQVLERVAQESKQEEATERMYTYLDLFRTREYAKRTVVVMCFWFYGFIAYYTLSYNMRTLAGNRYLNMFLGGFVDLPAMFSVILFNSVLGRRGALLLYLSITMATEVCVIGVYAADYHGLPIYNLPGITLAFALVGRASALAITYVMQIHTAELYATVVRNLGMGAGAVAGRTGGILAPQMVLLGTYMQLAPYVICLMLGLLFFGLAFYLPETRGVPLEELPPSVRKPQDTLSAKAASVNGVELENPTQKF